MAFASLRFDKRTGLHVNEVVIRLATRSDRIATLAQGIHQHIRIFRMRNCSDLNHPALHPVIAGCTCEPDAAALRDLPSRLDLRIAAAAPTGGDEPALRLPGSRLCGWAGEASPGSISRLDAACTWAACSARAWLDAALAGLRRSASVRSRILDRRRCIRCRACPTAYPSTEAETAKQQAGRQPMPNSVPRPSVSSRVRCARSCFQLFLAKVSNHSLSLDAADKPGGIVHTCFLLRCFSLCVDAAKLIQHRKQFHRQREHDRRVLSTPISVSVCR